MKKKLIIFGLFILTQGCTTWKETQQVQGDKSVVIKNAIVDFCNTSSLSKKDKVFSIRVVEINNDIIGVSILGLINKFSILDNGKSSNFPNWYLEYDDKLFYWHDKDSDINNEKEVVQKLNEYNAIIYAKSMADLEFISDDSKKGIDYYFCRRNLLIYEKLKTVKILGTYQIPDIKCQ